MLEKFIAFLLEQVRIHSIYVWGAQGQTGSAITEEWIRKRETSTTNANRAIAYWEKQVAAGYGDVLRAFDCSGLGMYFLQNLHGLYKSDMSANSMMGKCRQIRKSDLKRGDWVFRIYTSGRSKGKAYHIGYIVDDELNVVEAKGRDDGVVNRPLNASGTSYWNAFGRPDIFSTDINDEPQEATWALSRLLKKVSPMMKGNDVKAVQQALIENGFSCGKCGVDGTFGSDTETATKAFQGAQGLKADGIIGRDTCTALGGVWDK